MSILSPVGMLYFLDRESSIQKMDPRKKLNLICLLTHALVSL